MQETSAKVKAVIDLTLPGGSMHFKPFRFNLVALAVALAACSSVPAQPQVVVTVTGQTEVTFTATDPLVYTHDNPGVPTTIMATSDAGDFAFSIDIANPLKPGIYANGTYVSEGQRFNTILYECMDSPGCHGIASSSSGDLTIIRADDVISGELTVSLRGLDDSDYGEATATFTVFPARVVP